MEKKQVSAEVLSDKYKISAFVRMRDQLVQKKKIIEKPLFKPKSKDIMLLRYHPHLVKPHLNAPITRYRHFPNSFLTFLSVGLCFTAGYLYARLKKDEYLRRIFYGKYFNFITWFDLLSGYGETYTFKTINWVTQFDSVYSWWNFKKAKAAEIKAHYTLDKEIQLKMAQSDELSRVILDLD
jgi:hypothetical protein